MSLPYDPTRAPATEAVPGSAAATPLAGGSGEGERTVIRAPGAGGAVPGRPDGAEIATLEALPVQTLAGHPVSARTGEPRRPVLLGVACGLLYAGSAVAAAGLLKVLWDSTTVSRFPTAARVLSWIGDLQPVSFLAIVMVLLVAVIGAAVAAAAAVVAYNAWNGRSWSRLAGPVAVAVSLLTILLNPLAMVAMAPVAAGAALLWLPPLTPYFTAWSQARQPPPPPPPAGDVHYGPLPRYV